MPSPQSLDLVVVREPDSVGAQAYRSIRETLRHAKVDVPIRSALLADVGSRDQAGEAAANIAASFALNGDSTVLVDLDAADPVLANLLHVSQSPGLIEWLSTGADQPDAALAPIATEIPDLGLIPVGTRVRGGPAAPLADLMTDSACARLIKQLGESAHLVIFHASVAPISSQALTVAAEVDAVVLIIRSGTTKRTDAQRAKESLERIGANLLGVVLTD